MRSKVLHGGPFGFATASGSERQSAGRPILQGCWRCRPIDCNTLISLCIVRNSGTPSTGSWRNHIRRRIIMAKRPRLLRIESLEARALLAADIGLTDLNDLDLAADQIASIDGSGNNVDNPQWGTTNEQLLRTTTVEYADGISDPAGADRPSAREVSNAVAAQTESITNDRFLTDLVWLWGQFIDHDIDLTGGADPAEPLPIEAPAGDIYFDPDGSGDDVIDFNRSAYDPTTGDSTEDPRQQINQITAFLDGSAVYGSDEARAAELRTFDGGKLKVTESENGDLLPFNEAGLPNANPGYPDEQLFLAGDVRANENAALTAMHTLWVREHNRLADEIAADDPTLSDEAIYQRARTLVVAQIQAITFNEFLPALLGESAIGDYEGYDPSVNPGIANVFSTAAYRLGHSLLSPELLRLNNDGAAADEGNLALQLAFFAPQEISANGIESLLRGAAAQRAQELDTQVIDDVRNFLFGQPGSGGFDLASLNIQRGRDHGLADYNQTRVDLGLAPVASFAEITSDAELAAQLESLYGSVDEIDVWVGGLAEDHLPGSSVGELFSTIIIDQFERIRDGDRLWFENILSGRVLAEVESTTLADVIARNTDITGLQNNVFYDESVLYYKLDEGGRAQNFTITTRGDDVVIVDDRSGKVLASQALADTARVILVGGQNTRERITVDLPDDGSAPEAGVVIAGRGGGDTLIFAGSRDVDEFTVENGLVDVNGVQTAFDVSRIVLQSHRDDIVAVADDVEAVVEVANRQAHHDGGDRGDHRRDRDRRDGEDSRRSRKQNAPLHETEIDVLLADASLVLDPLFDDADRAQRRRR
jgi:hypothetical protein